MSGNSINHAVAFSPNIKSRSAAEMYILASIFQVDANYLEERQSAAQIFLYAHSIELFLKSYLVAHGKNKDELRNVLRHGLTQTLNLAESLQLPQLSKIDRDIIVNLDLANARANIRYEVNFTVNFLPEDLRRITGNLNKVVGPLVLQEVAKK